MDAEQRAREVLNSVLSRAVAEPRRKRGVLAFLERRHVTALSVAIAAALRQARAETIEECARVADREGGTPEATVMARSLAGQIRRLASPAPEAGHG